VCKCAMVSPSSALGVVTRVGVGGRGKGGEVDRLLAGWSSGRSSTSGGAGAVGLPEGGSGRPLAIWVGPFQGQEPVRGDHQCTRAVEACVGAAFVVV
jgi:hypothetical protein